MNDISMLRGKEEESITHIGSEFQLGLNRVRPTVKEKWEDTTLSLIFLFSRGSGLRILKLFYLCASVKQVSKCAVQNDS